MSVSSGCDDVENSPIAIEVFAPEVCHLDLSDLWVMPAQLGEDHLLEFVLVDQRLFRHRKSPGNDLVRVQIGADQRACKDALARSRGERRCRTLERQRAA